MKRSMRLVEPGSFSCTVENLWSGGEWLGLYDKRGTPSPLPFQPVH